MNSERKTWYLYPGQGLLELAGPMGQGGIGSGRYRVGEKVWNLGCQHPKMFGKKAVKS